MQPGVGGEPLASQTVVQIGRFILDVGHSPSPSSWALRERSAAPRRQTALARGNRIAVRVVRGLAEASRKFVRLARTETVLLSVREAMPVGGRQTTRAGEVGFIEPVSPGHVGGILAASRGQNGRVALDPAAGAKLVAQPLRLLRRTVKRLAQRRLGRGNLVGGAVEQKLQRVLNQRATPAASFHDLNLGDPGPTSTPQRRRIELGHRPHVR